MGGNPVDEQVEMQEIKGRYRSSRRQGSLEGTSDKHQNKEICREKDEDYPRRHHGFESTFYMTMQDGLFFFFCFGE